MNIFVFVFSVLIAAGCFWFSIKMIRLYFRVKKWNRTSATVLSKEIIHHTKRSTSRTPYGFKVNYTYNVNGLPYTSDKVYLVELIGGQANHMSGEAERRLEKIKDTMTVWVDPRDPSRAVMYFDGIGLYVLVFCLGFVVLFVGLTYLVA
jgi:hypothetical protein